MLPFPSPPPLGWKLIDTALSNLFRVQFRLGFLDPRELVKYTSLGEEVVNTPAHQALAKEAADQSLVLLKNDKATLPLKNGKSLVVEMNMESLRFRKKGPFRPAA